ncbi:MAG TPA: VCBS repeat-containing protein [Kofleriaceae bacterium]|jgi:hypothetical protein|nr:VCBS repeat-containing protein [Kofleriaceae bacterium]
MIVTRLAWAVTCAATTASCGWLAGLGSYGVSSDGRTGDAVDAPAGAPPQPTARFPWNGYDTGSPSGDGQQPRFSWPAGDVRETYEIELSPSCDVATMQTCTFGDTMPVPLGSVTSYVVPMPLAISKVAPVGARWFWRLAACNGSDCSWSDVRYLDVGRLANDHLGVGTSQIAVGSETGEVFVFRSAATVDAISTAAYGAHFGLAASIGDFDGDGFGDLAVYADGSGSDGVLVLEYGGPSRAATTIENATVMAGEQFGLASMSPGDLDGDGYDDLVVVTATVVSEFRGGSGGLSMPPSAQYNAEGTSTTFGLGFSGVGDVDGDGFPDFAVATDGGALVLFYGPLESGRMMSVAAPNATTAWGQAITGGDINGDGFSDVIASGVDSSTGGVVYAFYGGADGLQASPVQLFGNVTHGDAFGQALVYEPEGSGFAIAVGDDTRATLFYGAGQTESLLAPAGPITPMYGSVLGGGDMAGSGFSNIVVGSPGDMFETNACGEAYAFSVDPTGLVSAPSLALTPSDCVTGEQFGVAVSR